ncbi:hypothetical protein PVL29_001123 [Vitis rotundifolia]|uniref:Uncharacterized protein n=1 Tax=Vitis rotundifolia TaxID=103349 RepID=A0AA39AKT3_VITRO|nr:hypothetical protein PVL29_001123 [Vitis rotundifolia]
MKWLKVKVEGMEAQSSSPFIYALNHSQLFNEGILPCIDINVESMMKMKATRSKERLIARMYLLQQTIISFIHARLAVHFDHHFFFAALVKITSWLEKKIRQTKLPVSCSLCPFHAHTCFIPTSSYPYSYPCKQSSMHMANHTTLYFSLSSCPSPYSHLIPPIHIPI